MFNAPPLTLSALPPFLSFLLSAFSPPMHFPPCPRVPLPLVFNFLHPVTLIFRVSPVLQEKEIYTIDEERALNKSSQNRNQTVFIILLDCYGCFTPFIEEREP